jgi:hypothetical protein
MGKERDFVRRNADLIALAVLVLVLGFGSLGDGALHWLSPGLTIVPPLVKEWRLEAPLLEWRLAPEFLRLRSEQGQFRQEVECAREQAREAAEVFRRHIQQLRSARMETLRTVMEL